jgi:MFS family permease
MVGIGETYLPAFVLAVGLGEVAAGLIAAIPMVGGAVLQLLAPLGVRRLGSLRRWVILCAGAQALTFVPLVLAAVFGYAPAWFVFPVATLYWASGMATGPAWNTWVTQLIPPRVRATYFARRTRIAQICLLVAMLVGGFTLHAMAKSTHALLTFAALFSVAGLARLSSTRFLAGQSETRQDIRAHRRVLPWELLRRAGRSADGTLLFYMLGLQLMAQLAGPYFTPYMLERLAFPYSAYTTVIATAFLAKIAVMPLLGRFARRFGARRLLRVGGLAVVPLPVFWVLSDSFAYLLGVQVIAGIVWGAYELATLLLLFESIREDERTSVLTAFNLLNALATVGGALLGGALLKVLLADANAYHVLFLVSGVGRLLTLIPLMRVPDMKAEPRPISIRAVAVRPSVGSIDSPVLSSIANGNGDSPGAGDEHNASAGTVVPGGS